MVAIDQEFAAGDGPYGVEERAWESRGAGPELPRAWQAFLRRGKPASTVTPRGEGRTAPTRPPVGPCEPRVFKWTVGEGPRRITYRLAGTTEGRRMSAKRVLVAYGSKHGATAGIAEQVGTSLREDGIDAVVVQAGGHGRPRPRRGGAGRLPVRGAMERPGTTLREAQHPVSEASSRLAVQQRTGGLRRRTQRHPAGTGGRPADATTRRPRPHNLRRRPHGAYTGPARACPRTRRQGRRLPQPRAHPGLGASHRCRAHRCRLTRSMSKTPGAGGPPCFMEHRPIRCGGRLTAPAPGGSWPSSCRLSSLFCAEWPSGWPCGTSTAAPRGTRSSTCTGSTPRRSGPPNAHPRIGPAAPPRPSHRPPGNSLRRPGTQAS